MSELQAAHTPASEAELMARARALAGRTLAELSQQRGLALPEDVVRAKGYIGRLLELALGANGSTRDVTDFPALGIELKTLPIDVQGRPRESTFVCTMDLARIAQTEWQGSRVQQKLQRVLFVPIESGTDLVFGARRVGMPLLWSPSAEQEALLRMDFEEVVGRIARGDIENLRADVGQVLQVRPKAAHAREHTRVIDADGAPTRTLPRGFYLRASFTAAVVRAAIAGAEEA